MESLVHLVASSPAGSLARSWVEGATASLAILSSA